MELTKEVTIKYDYTKGSTSLETKELDKLPTQVKAMMAQHIINDLQEYGSKIMVHIQTR